MTQMTQSPIVKYGVAGILLVASAWGYEVGSASIKEMVSMPLVEEIKAQTKENVRSIPTSLQTLYLVQVNEGDFPSISSSSGEPAVQIQQPEPKDSLSNQSQKEHRVVKAKAPRIVASTESGAILSGYGFIAANETIRFGGGKWKLNGSFEKGYVLSAI